MPDISQLPHLLKLVDDESDVVRRVVIRELDSFGPALDRALVDLPEPPGSKLLNHITDMLHEHRRTYLLETWQEWKEFDEDVHKLEEGLTLISRFQNGISYPAVPGDLLDRLTDEYLMNSHEPDALDLAHFLFEEKRLRGAENDYYNYRNSDLVYVIENGRGIPISLACIYILVGHRLGLAVDGYNYPGHFMAKVRYDDTEYIIDCYYGGKVLGIEQFEKMYFTHTANLKSLLDFPPTTTDIMCRILLNLNKAYHQINDRQNSAFVLRLYRELIDGEDDDGGL